MVKGLGFRAQDARLERLGLRAQGSKPKPAVRFGLQGSGLQDCNGYGIIWGEFQIFSVRVRNPELFLSSLRAPYLCQVWVRLVRSHEGHNGLCGLVPHLKLESFCFCFCTFVTLVYKSPSIM